MVFLRIAVPTCGRLIIPYAAAATCSCTLATIGTAALTL